MIILLKIGWETGCETQSKENVAKLICVSYKEYESSACEVLSTLLYAVDNSWENIYIYIYIYTRGCAPRVVVRAAK